MIYLKSCPKCGGDVHFDYVNRLVDLTCLQCGKRDYFSIHATSKSAGLERQDYRVDSTGKVA